MQTEVLRNISVIVPSLNPDEKLKKTINSLLEVGFTDIICVNDGSREDCVDFFPAPSQNITILKHEVNRGKGAALKTAFAYIKENRPDSVGAVTVDGDGQHAAKDVLECVLEMVAQQNKIILGCRDFSKENVPQRSRFGNKITSGVFKVLCGMKISDTQTGLRAFPSAYYNDMLEVAGDRFEYETNMLLEMKARKIPYSEVKIETVYIEENKTSHFRPFKDSFRIYSLIFKFTFGQFFKYLLGSGLSFILDYALLYILLLIFAKKFNIDFEVNSSIATAATLASCAIARIFSSLVNYFFNRKIVFGTDEPIKNTILKYYALAIPMLCISATLTALLEKMPIINSAILIVVLKFIIDMFLFVANYFIQKKWVFRSK